MDYGFLRVASIVPRVNVADCEFNAQEIVKQMSAAGDKGAKVIVFPEMSLTGYTCGDLFFQEQLLVSSEAMLGRVVEASVSIDAIVFVGMPVRGVNVLYN